MKAVKEVTGGVAWHALSPASRQRVNRVLRERAGGPVGVAAGRV